MLYCEGFLFKINCIPTQTDDFATPKSVIGGENNHEFERIISECLEQTVEFVSLIEGPGVFLSFRALNFVCGVAVNQPSLVGVLQCFSDVCLSA